MKRTLFTKFWCCAFSLALAAATFADENPVISPKGTFTITQHYAGMWTTTLHFSRSTVPDINFPESYPWPALFYISPDDRWILQIQKSGSGDNISFLYELEPRGRLRPGAQPIGELAFSFLERSLGISRSDLYHTGISFGAWNLKAGLLSVSVHGSKENESGVVLDRALSYDLHKHSFRLP